VKTEADSDDDIIECLHDHKPGILGYSCLGSVVSLFICLCWRPRHTSPTSADQSHQSAVDRLRSTTRGDLVVSSSDTHFGAHAFAVAGPKAWNQLPVHLRALETVGPFRTALKTYLYSTLWFSQIVCTRRALVMTSFMLRRVRNRRRY